MIHSWRKKMFGASYIIIALIIGVVEGSIKDADEDRVEDGTLRLMPSLEGNYEEYNATETELGGLSRNCMACICHVEGCQKEIGKCKMDRGSLSCGPFQIKKNYWIDCGRPGGDWQTCTKQMACSEKCFLAYMKRYAVRCAKPRTPQCEDYAKIHNGGPMGCRKPLGGYWKLVYNCCRTLRGGCG